MADKAEWQDATELIGRAATDLGMGHMLYQEGYGMLEAMSALELMDLKMDSGTDYQSVHTYDERVASAQLKPIAAVTWEETLSAIDFLERAEVALNEGASAAQSTFTLHYFYHTAMTPIAPSSAPLPQRFLDLFCKLTLRCDEDLRAVMAHSGVMDEEDFSTMNYGWPTGEALREDELLRASKELLEMPSTDPFVAQAQERVRVRRALYMGLLALERTQLDAARKHLNVVATRAQPPAVAPLPDNFVEPLLIRRFEIPAAPRPVTIPTTAEAHKALSQMAARFLSSLETCAALVSSISFVDALHRLRPVAAWGHVERVRMCQLLSRPEVLAAITRHHMLECGLPKLLIDSAISVEMQISSRAETAMQVFLQTLCYNRSRSRRRMVVVLEELVVFNGEAQIADSSRRPDDPLYGPYYTSWSQDLALTAMILHLEAGLSAEGSLLLYSARELPWLFFYLEYLWAKKATTLNHVLAAYAQGLKRRRNKSKIEPVVKGPLVYQAELHHLMTRAIGRMFILHGALAKANGVTEESFPFGSNELRWSTRFYSLLKLHSLVTPLHYQHFAKLHGAQLTRPIAELVKETTECLEAVKERVKAMLHPAEGAAPLPAPLLEEAKKITRVAVLNGLAVTKATTAAAQKDARTDFAHHHLYPVFQF